MTTDHRFEDRLLAQLREVVAAGPAPVATAVPPRRARRTRLVLAASGVAAATAVVAVAVSSGGRTPSAYAVQAGANGEVTVKIRSLTDAGGLQQRLRAAGVPAVVDYKPSSGCGARAAGGPGEASFKSSVRERGMTAGPATGSSSGEAPAPADAAAQTISGNIRIGDDGAATFSIDTGELESGQKVWITTSGDELSSVAIGIGATRPAPPALACPPAAPAP